MPRQFSIFGPPLNKKKSFTALVQKYPAQVLCASQTGCIVGRVVSKSSVPMPQKKVLNKFEATGASETVRHKFKR